MNNKTQREIQRIHNNVEWIDDRLMKIEKQLKIPSVPVPSPTLKVKDWVFWDGMGEAVYEVKVADMGDGRVRVKNTLSGLDYLPPIHELTRTEIEVGDCVRHQETGKLMIVGSMLGILSNEICVTHVQCKGATCQWKLEDCILVAKR